ncbi:MAG: hypothetical protein WC503_06755 [Candidatus Shapirobacteria bacterium]
MEKQNLDIYIVCSTVEGMAPHDFRQVVGIVDSKTGEATMDNSSYLKNRKIEEEVLQVSPELALKLGEYFTHFVVDNPVPIDHYNCHHFASVMIGEERENLTYAPKNSILRGSVHNASLPVGQRGIYGWRCNGHADGYHSVIGLGEESEECIQVCGLMGPLGICSYETLVDYFEINPPYSNLFTESAELK